MKKNDSKTIEQGRAIARGIAIEQAQKDRNMAKAAKRKDTLLRNAAERAFGGNYSKGVTFNAPANN